MKLIISIISIALTAGCSTSTSHDVAMNIKKNGKSEVLIGSFDGSMAPSQGSSKTGTINVSNGKLNCLGTSTTGERSIGLTHSKVRHLFDMQCDDGRSGQLMANINGRSAMNATGLDLSGIGIGKLSDGSDMRVVFGDMSGTLAW